MTDAHYHRNEFETFLSVQGAEYRFGGFHPWQVGVVPDLTSALADLHSCIAADACLGVGEIGLDRLRTKTIPDVQRTALAAQLAFAAELGRPVVLHGAKCWGEVVKACTLHRGRIPAFLFHGFSRSAGLLPEIVALNGFVSVGPALLNDHAVNYREMVRELPLDRIVLETDKDWGVALEDGAPSQEALLTSLAHALSDLRKCPLEALVSALDANTARFVEALA